MEWMTLLILWPLDEEILTCLGIQETLLVHWGWKNFLHFYCLFFVFDYFDTQSLKNYTGLDQMLHILLYLTWRHDFHLCDICCPCRVLLCMSLDYVMQVDKVFGWAKFWEADAFHFPINIFPSLFAIDQILMNLPLRFLGHIYPVFGYFPDLIDVVIP
jgi:hypothetical protein